MRKQMRNVKNILGMFVGILGFAVMANAQGLGTVKQPNSNSGVNKVNKEQQLGARDGGSETNESIDFGSNISGIHANTCPPTMKPGKSRAICTGRTALIGANPLAGHFYKWTSLPTGFTSNLSKVQVTPNVTTRYFLLDSVSPTCFDTASVLITVEDKPTIVVKDTNVIIGDSVLIGAVAVPGYTYLWNTGETTAQIYSKSGVLYRVVKHTVEVFNSSGCKNIYDIRVRTLPTPPPTKTWTGKFTNKWSNPNNWNPVGVPTASDSVLIDSNAIRVCNLDLSNGVCTALYVAEGAKFRMNTSSQLSIARHFTIDGEMFTEVDNKLVFNGSINQSIRSTLGKTILLFGDIDVTTNKTLQILTRTRVGGYISLNTGAKLLSNGLLELDIERNTNIGGIFKLNGTSTVIGDVVVRRYYSTAVDNWTLIAPTVQNSTLYDYSNRIPMYGFAKQPTNPFGSGSSVYSYDEAKIGNRNDSGWSAPLTIHTPMAMGKGWNVYIPNAPLQLALTGTIVEKGFNFPITYTNSGNSSDDGWNLVGNPYPCAIDWNSSFGWTKTNISSIIYVFDEHTSQYQPWNGTIGTTTKGRYISVGQGFFIKATSASPALSCDENVKTMTTTILSKTNGESYNVLRIKATTQKNREDNAVVCLSDDASDEYDANLDAYKWRGYNVHLSTSDKSNNKMTLNYLSSLNDEQTYKVVPIQVEGANKLYFSNLESFDPNTMVYLFDAKLNKMIDVRENSEYQFENGEYLGRFSLVFSKSTLNSIPEGVQTSNIQIFPNPANDGILNIMGISSNGALKIMDMNGKVVFQQSIHAADKLSINTNLNQGVYIMQIELSNQVVNKKWIIK